MIQHFVEVWSSVTSFLTQNFERVISIFYDPTNGLTFLGTLAVVMSAVSLLLLIFNIIRSFFPMHG